MENRRFPRLFVPLGVEYHTQLPESGELHQGQGVLRDISLSGSYFHVEPTAPLKLGQTLSLTIAASLPHLDLHDTSHLKATGEVVRLDPPGEACPHYGVAIAFLEGPTFSSR
jgi:hypothetical protein